MRGRTSAAVPRGPRATLRAGSRNRGTPSPWLPPSADSPRQRCSRPLRGQPCARRLCSESNRDERCSLPPETRRSHLACPSSRGCACRLASSAPRIQGRALPESSPAPSRRSCRRPMSRRSPRRARHNPVGPKRRRRGEWCFRCGTRRRRRSGRDALEREVRPPPMVGGVGDLRRWRGPSCDRALSWHSQWTTSMRT